MSDVHRTAACIGASAAFAFTAPVAHAASFDCAQASTGMERLVCGDAALGGRDEILARLYSGALKVGKRGAVEARQRAWLGKAQACATAACLAEAYDERNAELQRSEGGVKVGSDFFCEEPKGNHSTLNVVGPVHGFASVSLMFNYVGPGGVQAGDVDTAATDAFLDLRKGTATVLNGRCRLTFERLGADG